MDYAEIAIWWLVVYWPVLTIFMGFYVATSDPRGDRLSLFLGLTLALVWPFTSIVMLTMLVYRLFVDSAATIRTDLRNRKLLKEFEQWLQEKEGKISPKDK